MHLLVDDFILGGNSIVFTSGSSVNSTSCFIFTPVNDVFIEEDEMFTFIPSTGDSRAVIMDQRSTFSIVIYDNDGELAKIIT